MFELMVIGIVVLILALLGWETIGELIALAILMLVLTLPFKLLEFLFG